MPSSWTSTRPTMLLLAVVLCTAPLYVFPCEGWVFRGVVPQDAPVVSVAVWESRAFLAVPRVWRDPRDAHCTFLHDGPTLLVAPWPEPGQPCLQHNATLAARLSRARALLRRTTVTRAFPNPEEQELARPDCLQSATAVALECGRGAARGAARLWVLDSGEVPTHALAPAAGPGGRARCPPKVVVYNLRGNNQRLWTRPFDGVPSSAISGLVVDPTAEDTRAYVGYPDAPGGAAIIVLSWKSKAFWQVRLQGMSVPAAQPRPGTTPAPTGRRGRGSRRRLPRQAMRSDQAPRQAFPMTFAPSSQWDVAVLRAASKKPRMVIAPRESAFMFDVMLDGLRGAGPDANHRNDALVPTSELGARRLVRKPGPGPSSGLLGDPSGGLLFFQAGPDGGAVMRWDPRLGAGPRGYAVVHRDNGTLPLTSAVFLDGQGAAWAACTTFASHHGDGGGIHHADEDADDYDDSEDESEDESDEDDGVINNEDHDDLEIDHFDDGDHIDDTPPPPPPSPTFRRSNSCRFPRAVGWKIREVAQRQDDGSRQDSEEHAAEPQEYVCMSPADAPSKATRVAPCASAAQAGSSRRVASRTRRPVKEDDVNTIMITRRAGQFDGSGLRTSAGHHKTVLVHDGHPAGGPTARRPRDPTHCVRLHWDEK